MGLFENKLKVRIFVTVFNVAAVCAVKHYDLRGNGVLFFVKMDLMYAGVAALFIFLIVKFSKKTDKQTDIDKENLDS